MGIAYAQDVIEAIPRSFQSILDGTGRRIEFFSARTAFCIQPSVILDPVVLVFCLLSMHYQSQMLWRYQSQMLDFMEHALVNSRSFVRK